jgi:F0F1-type ATP synthase alpha subunit
VAGRLRLDLAQYRELEAFASFSSDLDASSRATLDRGQRLVELLKQGQYSPFPVEREVVSLWLGTTGKLDKVPVNEVRRFESEFLDFVARGDNGIFDEIRQTKLLGDDAVQSLEKAVEAFASFSSDLDASSRATLDRGQRLVELLKQGQYSPFPVEREVVSLWLGTTGKLDRVPVGDVRRFEAEFLDHVARNHEGVYDEIRTSKALGDDAVQSLEKAVESFYGQFTTSDGETLKINEPEAEAMDASERGQERVQVKRSH